MLVLTVVALYFFRREDIPLETSSLSVLVILCLIFTVFPFEHDGKHLEPSSLFFGFGHEALVTVCALMIIGHALVRTGALVPVGRNLAKLWKISPTISLLFTLIIAGALSAFVNNTPIVVLLLPILTSVALRTHSDTSSMLLPMGLATLVGGMTTTIGTSTNLLVVSVASDMGLPRINMFDFSLPALIAGAIAIVYLWLIAPKLLPAREASLPDTSLRLFSAYLNINEDSVANGKTVAEIFKLTDDQMTIESIQRSPDYRNIMPFPDTVLKEGDRLHVKDTPDQLKEFESVLQATLFSGAHRVDDEHPLKAEKQKLAEIVVIQSSELVGRTLKDVQFARRYGISVLALHRDGKAMEIGRRSIGNIVIQTGDVLLVQGDGRQVAELREAQGFLIIDGASDLPHSKKAPVALTVLFLVVAVAAFGILPIAISSMCGILVLLATKCLDWGEVSAALSSQVVLIVVASLALGSAMMQTGGAEYIAQLFVALAFDLPPGGIISALMLMLAVLTNVVSNNAAAVIGTPIAVSVATQLNLPVEPFILAVLFGANLSYATPMAYKTNILVMNAGGYQFSDFIRVGVPLIILMWISLSFLLSWFYL
nr:SLC13 family permease [Thalassotalea sp. G2M2-11]